jgi:hypothetical protein
MDDETLVLARNELICNLLQTCANRDILDLNQLEQKADVLWGWVVKGSGESRPEDNRKDDSSKATKKPRGVRKGSTSLLV